MCEHLAVYLNSVGAGQSVYSLLSSPPHPPRYLTCFSLELQCYSKIHFTAIAAPGWRTGIGMKLLPLSCCAAGEPCAGPEAMLGLRLL